MKLIIAFIFGVGWGLLMVFFCDREAKYSYRVFIISLIFGLAGLCLLYIQDHFADVGKLWKDVFYVIKGGYPVEFDEVIEI
ncbi:MAG: hypothetical protein V3S42_04670 [Candidatus Neomarinimicrobiota bacterium]